MTSNEFIEDYPRLTKQRIDNIIMQHGIDTDENFFEDYQPDEEGMYNSNDLFGWLGY